jgi:hypothetical protein
MRNLLIFLSILLLFCVVKQVRAQIPDKGSSSVIGVGADYGITPEELVFIQNQRHSENKVPTDLLNELEEARRNGNYEKIQELNQLIITEYSEDVRVVGTEEYQDPENQPLPDLDATGYINQSDWLDDDVLVYATGQNPNYQRRNLDLKKGDDGNLYLVHAINQTSDRRIRVYQSTDGGANWIYKGGIYYPSNNQYIQTLSMIVDTRGTIDDSVRVMVYYTHSTNTDNNGASLAFFSFRPNTTDPDYLLKGVDSPPSGREFNYVSAFSDGQYWAEPTYIGCIVGDYSNDADSTYNINLYQSTDWGATHSSVSLPFASSAWVDRYPTAAFLPGNGFSSDSVMITTQRDFSGYPGLRVFITDWYSINSNYRTIFLTSGGNYEKPSLAIKQGPRGVNKDIIITCTKDSVAKYHRSLNGGLDWDLDFILDQRSPAPKNTQWTYVSSDSMGSTGDFIAVFSNIGYDSINVRRGQNGSLGSTLYKENSMNTTGLNPPICAIYRNPSEMMYSAFAYWGFGPENIYYDGENLFPNSVENGIGTSITYSLQQNYPNPFNPSTKISFDLPDRSVVSLKVFNLLGEQVAELVNETLEIGKHEYEFNSKALSSGVYFYKLDAQGIEGNTHFVDVKKMILMK